MQENSDGDFVVDVVIKCRASNAVSSTEKKLVANAVCDYLPGYWSSCKTPTGVLFTLKNDDYSDTATVYVNGKLILEGEIKPSSLSALESITFVMISVCVIVVVCVVIYLIIWFVKIRPMVNPPASRYNSTERYYIETGYLKYLSEVQFATVFNRVGSNMINAKLNTNNTNLMKLFDAVQEEKKRRDSLAFKNPKHLDYLSVKEHLDDDKQLLISYLSNTSPMKYTQEFIYFLNNYYEGDNEEEIAASAITASIDFDNDVSGFLQIQTMQENNIRQYAEELYSASNPKGLGFGIITTSVIDAAVYAALENHERKKQMANQLYKTSSVSDTGIRNYNNQVNQKIKIRHNEYVETMKNIINTFKN
jgi:hypothetical protein